VAAPGSFYNNIAQPRTSRRQRGTQTLIPTLTFCLLTTNRLCLYNAELGLQGT